MWNSFQDKIFLKHWIKNLYFGHIHETRLRITIKTVMLVNCLVQKTVLLFHFAHSKILLCTSIKTGLTSALCWLDCVFLNSEEAMVVPV